ncbi:hypothetical protein KKA17_03335 [bacterium]|nr:hypothetical protein [bacterium]MBU1883746.1 hypothetical protein [bacterium]
MGALSGVFAILSFFSEPFLFYFSQFINLDLKETSVPITLLLVSVVSFAFLYLQSGGDKSDDSLTSSQAKKIYSEINSSKKELEIYKNQISILNEKLEIYESEKGLSEEEKQKIIDGAVEQTSEDAIQKIFKLEADKLKDKIKEDLSFERLLDSSENVINRLMREIADLRLRSNINLLIGMSITAVGLYLLWSTVSMVDASALLKQLASEGADSNGKFLKNLILPIVPRILLVIFVEIFAYFFLRLYRDGLSEIKYFQNELTNVESKLVAVEFSYLTNNQDALKIAIESLSKTERNFILEKGQTTVELEKAKSESELTRNIIKTIPNFFKEAKK